MFIRIAIDCCNVDRKKVVAVATNMLKKVYPDAVTLSVTVLYCRKIKINMFPLYFHKKRK
jgi:hypothetical protein